MRRFLFLIAFFTLLGGANSVKASAPSKKEVATSGSTFDKQTYKKFHVTGVPELAFTINPFSMTYDEVTYDDFFINIAVPTTVGDWLFLKEKTGYGSGWQTISPGTSGVVKLEDAKESWTSLVLQAGDPAGERDIILKDVYYTKDAGATKKSILSTLGGEDYEVEEASAAGVKAFDMTSVDVSGYDQLMVEFASPTVGQWILNIDGNNETISAGTQYYKVDVSGKTTLSTLSLSVGSDELPRANIFKKLYLINPVAISSTSDWEDFADAVNGGDVFYDAYLTADVNAGNKMVGIDVDGKRYKGTFDGAGHTLTFTYTGGGQFVAPFSCIEGATIKDLLTAGSITTSNNMPAGIVGKNVGNSTLTRCGSSMTLSSEDSSNGRVGGLVGRCADGNQMTFNNCVYNGSISSAKSGYACGFVGWDNQPNKITLNNCLVAASSITNGGSNFINNTPTVPDGKYALYISQFGSSEQGTAVTNAQRYNGYVAYTLNQGIGDGALFFGQGYLNSSRVEDAPSLTSDASKKVYKENNNDYFANAEGLLPDPVQNSKLSWKHSGDPSAPYVYKLSTEKATSGFELVTTSDAYYLNVTSAGATTLILPCNIASLPSGVKAYNLTFDGSSITPIEVNSITANKPVLINASEGQYIFSTSLSWSETFDFSSITETTNGALTGVYNTELPFSYVPKDAYVLQKGASGLGFYKVNDANTIKITSFRAYLTADGSGARGFISIDEMLTGINEVKVNKAAMKTGKIYNLNGQIVSKPTKGLYIVDGKVVSF